jgi:hypothetical protein
MTERTKMETEMPPEPLDPAPLQARRGVLWLVVAHVAVGFVAALLVDTAGSKPGYASLAFGSFWFGQASLLGIWLGLGTGPHITRVLGVALGITFIWLSIALGSGDWSAISLMVLGVGIVSVSPPLLVARYFRIVIQVDSSPTTLASRLRFSIRHLLILTFMVACAITLGRIVLQDSPQRDFLLGLMIYGTIFQLTGFVPVWLILATKRPVTYGVGLVAISACVGYSLGWNVNPPASVSIMTALATGTSVVVVSLLVVRLCGFRLVRLPKLPRRRIRPRYLSVE